MSELSSSVYLIYAKPLIFVYELELRVSKALPLKKRDCIT